MIIISNLGNDVIRKNNTENFQYSNIYTCVDMSNGFNVGVFFSVKGPYSNHTPIGVFTNIKLKRTPYFN